MHSAGGHQPLSGAHNASFQGSDDASSTVILQEGGGDSFSAGGGSFSAGGGVSLPAVSRRICESALSEAGEPDDVVNPDTAPGLNTAPH